MIPKKSSQADLERKRPAFFLLGLALALVAAIYFLQYKTPFPTGPDTRLSTVAINDGPAIPITLQLPKEPKLTHKRPKPDPTVLPVIDDDDPWLDTGELFPDDGADEPLVPFGLDDGPEPVEAIPWVLLEKIAHPADCGGLEGDEQKACLNKWVSNFIGNHVVYPKDGLELNLQGRVYVSFVVTETGAIEEVKVVKGEYEALNRAAEKAVREMPSFVPASQFGNPVRMSMTVPVTFKRQGW